MVCFVMLKKLGHARDFAIYFVRGWHLVVVWLIWRLYALGWDGVNEFGGAVGGAVGGGFGGGADW